MSDAGWSRKGRHAITAARAAWLMGFLLAVSGGARAQTQAFSARFVCGSGRLEEGFSPLSPDMRYTPERGYGFLRGPGPTAVDYGGSDALRADGCLDKEPFSFAVDVPEGYFEVVLTLGDRIAATETTVRDGARRLLLENVRTGAGSFETRSFTVEVRSGAGRPGGQLNLEFSGAFPAVAAIEITGIR